MSVPCLGMSLSGGERRRTEIARTLATDPKFILLDEPFAGVDAATETAIVELLRDLKERGKTLIVVHHDLSSAREYFDKLLLLNMRLVAYGEMEETFTPDLLQKTYGGRLTILSDVAGQAAGRSEFEQEGDPKL